ncbi:LCP family protein [Turicibacter sp. TJ11]|uniref:LCP family protein n=1 Tax=Turicibacter sp. TJ11 TaxID=2806443 RepID=UPI001F1C5F78|nr:LCP family protein [Turicibacter sp. TJ11]
MKKWKIILTIVLALLIVPVAVGAVYMNLILDKVTVSEDEFDKDFDLNVNTNLENSDVKNIALFGVDCRTDDYSGCRSDVMMVLSYNQKENNVTVTSLVRDTYVEIGDRGFDKLNHAYAFGGAELAIQTINKTFDLNIEDYVTVDFWAVEAIIDALGGVMIDVSSKEMEYVNDYMNELNTNSPDGHLVDKLTNSGYQRLNGRQAVAYMRIRHVGDGDFERMQRQREVMEVALEGMKTISLSKMLTLVNDLISTVKTNLSKGEIIDLVTKVATKGIPKMEQFQLPTRDEGVGMNINGIYYFVPNTLLENVRLFHESTYQEQIYEPSDYVISLSDKLQQYIY